MSATVERIRQEIDQLAPEEIQELFADLQHDYAIQVARWDESAPQVDELSAADQAKIEALHSDIQVAVEQLDRGEGIEIDWEDKLARRHQAFAARKFA